MHLNCLKQAVMLMFVPLQAVTWVNVSSHAALTVDHCSLASSRECISNAGKGVVSVVSSALVPTPVEQAHSLKLHDIVRRRGIGIVTSLQADNCLDSSIVCIIVLHCNKHQ